MLGNALRIARANVVAYRMAMERLELRTDEGLVLQVLDEPKHEYLRGLMDATQETVVILETLSDTVRS